MSNQLQSVSFHNQQITVLNHDNKPYIEMRSIVENIGLNWASQFKRIQRNKILNSSVVMMTMVAKDGKNRELMCLPLGYLNGWLFGIDTNRVKPEIRATLEQYQLECFDVLYNHFMPKVAQQYPNTISIEQQQMIKRAVQERAYRTGEHFQAVYHSLYEYFKIPRYQELPASKFDEAMKFLNSTESKRDYRALNIDNLKRQHNYLATIQEYYYRIFDEYNEHLADFLTQNSPQLHYNISTALNKMQMNIGLSLNHVRSEITINTQYLERY